MLEKQVTGPWKRRIPRRTLLRGLASGLGVVGVGSLACAPNNRTVAGSGSSASSISATAPAGPPTSIKTASTGIPVDAPLYLARDSGIFQQHNLSVSLTSIPGPASVAALVAGDVQFDHPGGTEVLAAAVAGADLVIIAVQSTVFAYKFFAKSGIKTVADLKGKKVGITAPGGSFDLALRQALPTFGLQPDKDVTFIASGSIANVEAALLAGAIDGAAIVVGPDLLKVQSSGVQPLFDFADLNLQTPGGVIALQRSYMISHRADVQRYIDSIIQATTKYKQDKADSLVALGKIYQTDDQAGLNVAYDYYTRDNVMPRLPYPKVDQFRSALDALCKRTDKACGFDASKVVDASFVQNSADRGLGK
jgi:NitT/TauT family transport system substrate-binding protein